MRKNAVLEFSRILRGLMVKAAAWHDQERGYSCHAADRADITAKRGL